MRSQILAWLVGIATMSALQVRAQGFTDREVKNLGGEFTAATTTVRGGRLYYVRGGQGPTIVLIHGFPEDWYEFHTVMARLANHFSVIALDLPGIGKSSDCAGGFEAAEMAQDVHDLVEELKFQKVYLVGHDIGGDVPPENSAR